MSNQTSSYFPTFESKETLKTWRDEVKHLKKTPKAELLDLPIQQLNPSPPLVNLLAKVKSKTISDILQQPLINLAKKRVILKTLEELLLKLKTLKLNLTDDPAFPEFYLYNHPTSSMCGYEEENHLCIKFTPLLSLADIPEVFQKSLSSWIKQFLDKTPTEIAELLRKEWSVLKTDTAKKLSNYFLTLTPSIAIDEEHSWLVFKTTDSELFLREPHALTDEEEKFISTFNDPSLRECSKIFHRITESDTWGNGLDFWIYPHSDVEYHHPEYNPDELTDWEGGTRIYSISSGDSLLMAKDGRIAQSLHEIVWSGKPKEGTVHVLNSFSDLIDYYILYLKGSSDSINPLFWGDYERKLDLL